ncbi:MAG TPA: 2-dehydropantoate 2-reductase [Deferrisomatales bacterium]|nr:2-dehydropantoate 2-reductase [Deferrisomatales bacterium]
MNVAVIGAGAMGSLFGALLAEAGNSVCLIDIWAEHVRAINAAGLAIEREGASRTIPLRATSDPGVVGTVDLALIFVKATHTAAAAETARSLIGEAGLVLTLQNGLGNADTIAEVVAERRVLAGTTAHGATLLGPGRIRHAGAGPTVLGSWSRQPEGSGEAKRVAEVFTSAGFETVLTEDVRQALWGKLLINVGINAITALTGIRNGQILDLPATGELSRAAVAEAVAVAKARGVTVREDAAEHVLAVAAATAANRSSMGQDVDNRRLTEIDAINGAVVREARRVGLAAPVNQTLAALVETLQAHYR